MGFSSSELFLLTKTCKESTYQLQIIFEFSFNMLPHGGRFGNDRNDGNNENESREQRELRGRRERRRRALKREEGREGALSLLPSTPELQAHRYRHCPLGFLIPRTPPWGKQPTHPTHSSLHNTYVIRDLRLGGFFVSI